MTNFIYTKFLIKYANTGSSRKIGSCLRYIVTADSKLYFQNLHIQQWSEKRTQIEIIVHRENVTIKTHFRPPTQIKLHYASKWLIRFIFYFEL